MSGSPRKRTCASLPRYVRFVPKPDSCTAAKKVLLDQSRSGDGAAPSVADCQASPVGTIVAVSIIRMTAFSGARVRWITPFGTTKPCCGESATERPSRSMMNVPLSTKKELVIIIVLVPMVLALHDAETHD